MELAFPTVVGEAGLLRREVAGALDRGQVLREHDPPFELAPARIVAAGEIDRAAGASRTCSSARATAAVASKSDTRCTDGAGVKSIESSSESSPDLRTKSCAATSVSLPPRDQARDVVLVVVERAGEVGRIAAVEF